MLLMIVDNNAEDIAVLQKLVLSIMPEASLMICTSQNDALAQLRHTVNKIDVFFINTKLNVSEEIHLIEEIRSMEEYYITPVLFISERKADELFLFQKYHVHGFLYKPYDTDRRVKHVAKLLRVIKSQSEDLSRKKCNAIEIKTRNSVIFMHLEDIVSIEVMGKDCTIHTFEEKVHIPRITLQDLLSQINHPHVVRCHKSFAVNIRNISHLVKKKRNLWQPIYSHGADEEICYISATYYDHVLSCIRGFRTDDAV